MSEFKYRYDCEREELQKYKEIYTKRENELNKRLYQECTKRIIDFKVVEELLRQGADPLGPCDCEMDPFDHIYEELICESQDSNSKDLPKITELFLKYGMNVENPRVEYSDGNSVHPLWAFAFVCNENAIHALKMLLDNGLSADSFGLFWDHSMVDFFHCDCGDPQNDEFWNYECIWTFKMIMLGASYDHILENDECLREFICCECNTYDIHNFSDWNRYEYYFDTSHCDSYPELYKSVVHIYEKDSGNEVWKIGVGIDGRKLLVKGEK